jgi:hypothetical protein
MAESRAPNQSQMATYFKESQKMGFRPDSPFTHGAYLLQADDEDFATFQSLINKRVLLAFIETPVLMSYYQTDIRLLMAMFDIARREPAMRATFMVQYNGWVGELSMTRAMKGMERKLQANASGGYQPGQMSGMSELETMNSNEKNFFSKIFGGRKQQHAQPQQPQ